MVKTCTDLVSLKIVKFFLGNVCSSSFLQGKAYLLLSFSWRNLVSFWTGMMCVCLSATHFPDLPQLTKSQSPIRFTPVLRLPLFLAVGNSILITPSKTSIYLRRIKIIHKFKAIMTPCCLQGRQTVLFVSNVTVYLFNFFNSDLFCLFFLYVEEYLGYAIFRNIIVRIARDTSDSGQNGEVKTIRKKKRLIMMNMITRMLNQRCLKY